ncbi:MAG: HopJ type III effector protein [Ferruginibacter sp.]
MLEKIKTQPQLITFQEVIDFIDARYQFTPTAFTNGSLHNEAGQNNGSCKIFQFVLLNHLTKEETLHCFGHYYREHVLGNPAGTDHANIRNFMVSGFEGLQMEGVALVEK